MIRSKYGASSREYKAMLEIVQTGKMSAPKDVGADLLLASKSAWSSKKKMMPGAAFAGMLSGGKKNKNKRNRGVCRLEDKINVQIGKVRREKVPVNQDKRV